MYDLIDLPELKRMADLAESTPEPLFNMGCVLELTNCGTAGCLLGTWGLHSQEDRMLVSPPSSRGGCWKCYLDGKIEDLENASVIRFGIGVNVVNFLFFDHNDRVYPATDISPDAVYLSKKEAIARLRKFISYVEDQRRKWTNHEWLMQRPKSERRAILLAPRRKQEAVAV